MKKKEELNAVAPAEIPGENPAEAAEKTEPEKAPDADGGENAAEGKDEPAEKKKKKGPFIQLPVLISLLIVVLAAAGYFVYSAYFLHLPQEIVWKEVKEGITHYYEFSEDNMFTDTWASYERSMSYEELTEGGKDIIRVYFPEGIKDFECSMTGSRLKKNQTLTLTDSDGDVYINCEQVESKTGELVLPTEVQLDPKLTGEWECRYNDSQEVRLNFAPEGMMRQDFIYHFYGDKTYIETYIATYTISNGYVFYTYAMEVPDEATGLNKIEYVNDHRQYELERGYLKFLKDVYTRVKSPATPDEAS